MSDIDNIKSKIDIAELIHEYVPLRLAGANHKGLCPFHDEQTPSFMVSREKQIFHCFGCGEGGDIFSFVQKIEGAEFPEALKILAKKAGVELTQQFKNDNSSKKTKLWDINRLASEYYHAVLLQSKLSGSARKYLQDRGLSDETIQEFKIGFAPESWDAIITFLKKRKFSEQEIAEAGLSVKNSKGGYYDRFRSRIMFPIWDVHDNVVGFTARILDESKLEGGKYVNTPQTLVYNKSETLYGLNKAKREVKNKDSIVVVEGQMDVIASHQAGVKNVVASSGTAFTHEQLRFIKRFTNNLVIAFDFDEAGRKAAMRGIDNALSEEMNIKIVQLPKEIKGAVIKDPDDCIKASPEIWQKSIDDALPLMGYIFDTIMGGVVASDPQDVKEKSDAYLNELIKLPDVIEQDFYVTKLANSINKPEDIIRERIKDIKEKHSGEKKFEETKKVKEKLKPKKLSKHYRLCFQLLSLAIAHPKHFSYIVEHLIPEYIVDKELTELYKEMIVFYNTSNTFSYKAFCESAQNKTISPLLSKLHILGENEYIDFTQIQLEREVMKLIRTIQKSYINKALLVLQKKLSEVEKNNDRQQIDLYSRKIAQLLEQKKLNNI